MEKLYIIVRNDLSPGLQLPQACHAMREFINDFPELDRKWFDDSKNIVVLQVQDEAALRRLYEELSPVAPRSIFEEPDLDNAWTAMAVGGSGSGLLSSLPLALRS